MNPKEITELKLITQEMVEIYETKKLDWMGIPINKENRLSFMLINQKFRAIDCTLASERKNTNIALLSYRSIRMLEAIRTYYPELYNEYLFMFQIINDFNCPPTFEIMQIMNNMLERLEAVIQTKPEGLFTKRFRP